MNKFKSGDRFYFYKNNTDSDTIKVGYKGIVCDVYRSYLTCGDVGEYAFGYDEVKPIIKCYAVLGEGDE